VIDVNASHTSEEGAHSPRWPNGLIIIIIIIVVISIIIVVIIIVIYLSTYML
jgi:flagellar basal body-associated protein FliL